LQSWLTFAILPEAAAFATQRSGHAGVPTTHVRRPVFYLERPEVLVEIIDLNASGPEIDEKHADAVSDDVSNSPVPATRNQRRAGPSNQIELMTHAKRGNAGKVARLTRAGVDVNERDESGHTPLMWAALSH
jgi:hypothetical protein